MTFTGIEFAKLLETKRNNQAQLAEQHDYNQRYLNEQERSNRARETETHRSNLINENISFLNHKEQVRSNMSKERISREQNAINDRHFTRMDYESRRHNMATEGLSAAQINLGYQQLSETQRANLAKEDLQGWATSVNEKNANTNRMNALTNIDNANINRFKSTTDYLKYLHTLEFDDARKDQIAAQTKYLEAQTLAVPFQVANQAIGSLGTFTRGVGSIIPLL